MKREIIEIWQECFVAGLVVATLQFVLPLPPAQAAVGAYSLDTPLASIGATPVEPLPDSGLAGSSCEECSTPAQLRNGVSDLVVTTVFADGSYVAVWQDKNDNRIFGRCYSRDDQPRGTAFRIDAGTQNGSLPVILVRRGGGFIARWQQDNRYFEQHFDSHGVAVKRRARVR